MGAGKEFEGKDLDEALRTASKVIGAPPGEISYELLTEGRRGVFGIGARNVRIWVNLPDGAERVRPALEESFRRVATPEQSAWVHDMLRGIVDRMGFDLEIRTTAGAEGGLRVQIGGADTRYLVARDAELLTALQFVINRMVRQWQPESGRVQLECEGYRDRRDLELIQWSREVAQEVARTGSPRWLHPMNPYERRLVHLTVREFPGLTSHSEGLGFLKKIKVSLSEPKGEA